MLKLKLQSLATWCQEPTHWKDPDAGKDWGQGEKGATDNEMVGWRHWLNGHEFERTLGDSEGQEAWRAAVRGVTKSQTWLSGWIPTTIYETSGCYTSLPAFGTVCFLNFSHPGRLIAIISLRFIALIFWPHLKVCEILDSWPGIEPVTPSVEAQSFNHWTKRQISLWCLTCSSPGWIAFFAFILSFAGWRK